MSTVTQSDRTPRAAADTIAASSPRRAAIYVKPVTAGLMMTMTAIALLPIGLVTLFRARRLYCWIARVQARAILRLYGVTLRVHGAFPRTQTVYISNHPSTLDLFVLVALGLPRCRFFLSGFLRKIVPLGIISTMMGTFFTVPQDRPDERREIFKRAERILRRSGESVYLSPEGGRAITGVGPFNKGAFHLVTNLGVPLVPMYFRIPPQTNPGLGYDVRPGTVDVYVLPPIDTRDWRLEDLIVNKERTRDLLVAVEERIRCA